MGFITKTIEYNPPDITENESITTDTIDQSAINRQKPDRSEAMVKIQITDNHRKYIKDLPVRLWSKDINKVYTTQTSSTGEAVFFVPPGKTYAIGIAQFDKYQ